MDMPTQPGRIITFYSYKGGTGRSMALANVACLLARRMDKSGRVLIMDWDLEAPGLHRYFASQTDQPENTERPGVINYFRSLLELFDQFSTFHADVAKPNGWETLEEKLPLSEFLVSNVVSGVDLIKAGRFDSEYPKLVGSFDWIHFYKTYSSAITAFRKLLTSRYSYCLVDSRTGLTDISGICTALLPETLVAVFTPNRQSLYGLTDVLEKSAQYRLASSDFRPLSVFPLPSRIDGAEDLLKKEWRKEYQREFQRLFNKIYGLECDLTFYFDEVQLPHVSYYAYGENIAVLRERPEDVLSLSAAYDRFFQKLVKLDFAWEVPTETEEDEGVPRSVASQPARNLSFDVFLNYAHVDAEVVEKLGARLEDEGGLRVWLDQWVLVPGEQWQQGVARALEEVDSCAVCVGTETPSGWFDQEIQRALNRQAKDPSFRVIPVILPGGDPSLVNNFLEWRTWVQFKDSLDDRDALHRLISGIKGVSPGRAIDIAPEPAKQLFTVPLPKNPFFTGREEVLEELKKTLDERGIAALTGLGGMGKTQTAAQYAHLHRQEYQAVLWVRAESEETLFSDLSQLAARLELPEREAKEQSVLVESVKLWLDGHESWLLVLDNVEDYVVVRDLARKASANGHHVVITTQSQALGQIGRQRLSPMDRDVGALLLLRRASWLAADAPLSGVERKDAALAREISDEVGGLPLALDQAGAYLEETGSGFEDYLTLLRQRAKELLGRRGGLDSDHLSVAATLLTSFEKLAIQSEAAADLLQATAFLSPDAIPEEVFTQGAEEFGPVLRAAASDPIKWDETIAAGFKFSLIERKPSKLLAVHRMVQAVAKSRLSPQDQRKWAEQVVRAVNEAFPQVEFAVWDKCERLLLSAQVCAALVNEYRLPSPEVGRLLNRAGSYLFERARYGEAELLYRRALTIDERSYGSDHPNVAATLNNLAVLLWTTNRLAEAEPLMRRALAIDEKALGLDHPNVARDLNNLAQLLQNTKRLSEAEPLVQQALAIDERAYGPDHPNVAVGLNNLALLLLATNRLGEAEPLYRRALAIREKALGPDHPDVAQNLNNLALLLDETNRRGEAEPLMRRALEVNERAYGPDHPAVARGLNNLAALLKDTNRSSEAEALYRRALAINEKALGQDHPSTVISREELAGLLHKRGRDEEVERLFRRKFQS